MKLLIALILLSSCASKYVNDFDELSQESVDELAKMIKEEK